MHRFASVLPVLLVGLVLTVAFAAPLSARTWHILPDGSGDAPTIQAGVDSAAAGDTVKVSCGTYYEHDIILRSDIHLTSETGGADCVTINALREGRVLHCDTVGSACSIVGFTVAMGLAVDSDGGGLYCLFSSPTVTDCVFRNNCADHNGGGAYAMFSSPVLRRCTFVENGASEGGGLYCDTYSSFVIEQSIVAFSTQGSAVSCIDDGMVVLGCRDLYGNAGGDFVGFIAAQLGVAGNFSADPLFCGDENPDDPYTLLDSSPCLPGNHPYGYACGLVGARGAGCQAIALTPQTWARVKAGYR